MSASPGLAGNGSGISVALLVLPAESPGGAGPPARVIPLLMRASVAGADVSLLRLEVTGPGLDAPVAAELPVENGAASGTLSVPVGPQRVFALRALAAGGGSYCGTAATDVRAGSAALLTVALEPNGNGNGHR